MATNESLTEILDKAHETDALKDIAKMSPAVLQGVSENDAKLLQEAFGIKTVSDMATNKFFLWAQAIHTLAQYEK
ncbi:MAG: hypothetical protein GVY13_06930 [Alphaproteobacteria bacterium]|jgi:hypothetical protein|nr:hypothetical protein [Alphaproteobacteria bacterium]